MADQENPAPLQQQQPQTAQPVAERMSVIDPNGTWGSMDVADAQKAIKSGDFRSPTPNEIHDRQMQELYGEGAGSALKATAAGVARGYTFGLSDLAQTKTGAVDPDTLEYLKKYHPILSTAGEIGGVAGGLLTGGGEASALAKTAQVAGQSVMEAAHAAPLLAHLINPVKAVAKLGDIAGEASRPFLEKAVGLIANTATRPLVNKILAKASTAALGSAVEGTAYGLGQSVSEYALGDPSLNADKVLANVGYSALLGGALGGTLRAGEIAAPEAIQAARDTFGNLYNKASGAAGKVFSEASSAVSGKSAADIYDAFLNRAKSGIEPEEFAHLSEDFSKGLNEHHAAINKALRTANKDIRPEEIEHLTQGVDPGIAQTQVHEALGKLGSTIDTMRAEPDLYPSYYPRTLEMIRDRVAKGVTPEMGAADSFKLLDDLKSRIDTEIKYGKVPTPQEMGAQNAVKELRLGIKQNLEDEGLWGPSASRQAAFNEAQRDFIGLTGNRGLFRKYFMQPVPTKGGGVGYEIDPGKVRSFFSQLKTPKGEEKGQILTRFLDSSKHLTDEMEKTHQSVPSRTFDKEALTNLLEKNQKITSEAIDANEFRKTMNSLGGGAHNVPVAEAAGMLALGHINPLLAAGAEAWNLAKAPALLIQRLAKIEKLVQKTTDNIVKGAKFIFKIGGKAGEPIAPYLGSKINQARPDSDERKKEILKSIQNVQHMSSDASMMMKTMDNATHHMSAAAPDMTAALHQSVARATQFLASKAPEPPAPLPLSLPYVPSDADIFKYGRYLDAVEHPQDVLKQVATSTITSEAMETLQTVYPQLLQDMRVAVVGQMTEHLGKSLKIPYSTKLSLTRFLGQDMDYSMTQQHILFNQLTLSSKGAAQAMSQSSQPIKTTQSGLGHLNASNRALTPMQKTAQREKA